MNVKYIVTIPMTACVFKISDMKQGEDVPHVFMKCTEDVPHIMKTLYMRERFSDGSDREEKTWTSLLTQNHGPEADDEKQTMIICANLYFLRLWTLNKFWL